MNILHIADSVRALLRLVARAAITCVAVLAIGLTFATPPTPPARIEPPEPAELEALTPEDGRFIVPLRIIAIRRVSDVSLEVKVTRTDPIDPTVVQARSQDVTLAHDETRLDVELEAQREPALYKVSMNLEGNAGNGMGIQDRFVFYQIVDGRGARLITPTNLRRLRRDRRWQTFLEQLEGNPLEPDVRLLAPPMVDVPPEVVGGVVRYEGVAKLSARAAGPPNEILPYIEDGEPERGRRDPIVARGQVLFHDFEKTWRPLVNVSVSVYDDGDYDQHVGTTVTDWDGVWTLTIEGSDEVLQGGRDLYYMVLLANEGIKMGDQDGHAYFWTSEVVPDVKNGTVVDFGEQAGTVEHEAAQIFSVVNLGWDHVNAVGKQDPGEIKVQIETTATGWFPELESVWIESKYNDGPDLTLHEYGHALMYAAFGGESISPGGFHYFEEEKQDKGLAFSEGWATAFALSVCPDGEWQNHEDDDEKDGEWPDCEFQDDEGGHEVELLSNPWNRVGEENEGRVAAAINDLLDKPDDDNGGNEDRGRNGHSDSDAGHRVSLATIYRDSMWGHVHPDFLELWSEMKTVLEGDKIELAEEIMLYNWMSLSSEDRCAAVRVAAIDSGDPDDLLDGLRLFRDYGLKPLRTGRRLIEVYYRHSPELAALLIRNEETRNAATLIVEYASILGRALATHKGQMELFRSEDPAIPRRVAEAIRTAIEAIEADGSPELKRELGAVRRILDVYEDLSLRDALRLASTMTRAEKGPLMTVIEPYPRAEASREVDWEEIRRFLKENE